MTWQLKLQKKNTNVVLETQYLLSTSGANTQVNSLGQIIGANPSGKDYRWVYNAIEHEKANGPQGLNYEGVYFCAPSLNPSEELAPGLNQPFIQITESNLVAHVLAPAYFSKDTNVETYIYFKLWDGNQAQWAEGKFLTNVVLKAEQAFHNYPTSGSITTGVYRAILPKPKTHWLETFITWQIKFQEKKTHDLLGMLYLLASPSMGAQTNGLGQILGADLSGHDYRWIYKTHDPTKEEMKDGVNQSGLYFSVPHLIAPENEIVPGLNKPFLSIDEKKKALDAYILAPLPIAHGSNLTAYVYLKFWDGEKDHWVEGKPITNVVFSSENPFHGYPASGITTSTVYQANVPLPEKHSAELYMTWEIKAQDKKTDKVSEKLYLVATEGSNVTVNTLGQFLTTNPANKDYKWVYVRKNVAAKAKKGVNRNGLFFNAPKFAAPEKDIIPSLGKPFLSLDATNHLLNAYMLAPEPLVFGTNETGEIYFNCRDGHNDHWVKATPEEEITLNSKMLLHGVPSNSTLRLRVYHAEVPMPKQNWIDMYMSWEIKAEDKKTKEISEKVYLVAHAGKNVATNHLNQLLAPNPESKHYHWTYFSREGIPDAVGGVQREGLYFNAPDEHSPSWERVPGLWQRFVTIDRKKKKLHAYMLAPQKMTLGKKEVAEVYFTCWDGEKEHWAKGKLHKKIRFLANNCGLICNNENSN